jgi:hypothetical protein
MGLKGCDPWKKDLENEGIEGNIQAWNPTKVEIERWLKMKEINFA